MLDTVFYISKAKEVKMNDISKYSYELGELNSISHTGKGRKKESKLPQSVPELELEHRKCNQAPALTAQ